MASPLGKVAKGATLLIVPTVVVLAALSLREARGPYWLGTNSDPDYYYLVNSLALAAGHSPSYSDHPGTPLTMIGAVVIRVIHAGWGEGPLERDVLGNPEFYLTGISNFLLFSWFVVLLILGGGVCKVTGNSGLAALAQSSPLLSVNGLASLPAVSPEALLLLLSVCLAAAVMAYLAEPARHNEALFALLFGSLVGLALATKLSAVPFLVLLLVLLPSWYKALSMLCAAWTFLGATLLVFPEYAVILYRARRFTTHMGIYGRGGKGVIDPANFFHDLLNIIQSEMLLAGIIVLSSLTLAFLLVRKLVQLRSSLPARALLAVVLVEWVQILLVARNPAGRYLTPCLGLLGLNLVLLFLLTSPLVPKTARPWYTGTCVLALAAAVAIPAQRFWYATQALAGARIAQEDVCRKVESDFSDHAVIYHYGASSPAYALAVGNWFAGGMFSRELQRLHPNALFCRVWTFGDYIQSRPLQDTTAKDARVLFQGWVFSNMTNSPPVGLEFEQIYPPPVDGVPYVEVLYKPRRR